MTSQATEARSGGRWLSRVGVAGDSPTLALVLAVALVGYVVWTADRLPALARVTALAARGKPAQLWLPGAQPQPWPARAQEPSGRTLNRPAKPPLVCCRTMTRRRRGGTRACPCHPACPRAAR
jgi:hypothetical protein